jgi:hypothetical protein
MGAPIAASSTLPHAHEAVMSILDGTDIIARR